jgi:hypothetical protein
MGLLLWLISPLAPTFAAVIPNLSDSLTPDDTGSIRAAVLAEGDRQRFVGRWQGRTGAGRTVAVDLRFKRGLPSGTALLVGLLPDAADGPVDLLAPHIAGRTVSFSIQAGCPSRPLTRGRMTVLSADQARLVVRTTGGPVSIELSKVG